MRKLHLMLFLLFLAFASVLLSFPQEDSIRIVACDVGQGDAIIITSKDKQVLIDGGPNGDVIDCVSKQIPFWDRKIEAVILTHPEKDHYNGLIEVFRRYDVDTLVANSLDNSSQGYQVLKDEVGGTNTRVVNPDEGMLVSVGLIHLDILYPDKQTIANYSVDENTGVLGTYTSNVSPNEFSIVARLRYGEFDALFTGDITPEVSDILADSPSLGEVEYIKIPHHGSKNGLTQDLLEKTDPMLAVISVGKNQWGHPNDEIINMLKENNTEILRTDQMGDIIIEVNEKGWRVIN